MLLNKKHQIQIYMIIKLITKIRISQFVSFTPSRSFVMFNIFKKRLQGKQSKFKPTPQTYSAPKQQQKKQQKQQKKEADEETYEAQYDFFSRQKQIELNKDFRKIKEQSTFIPPDIGKGGFDEIVYWSQFAKTPEQIVDLVKAFNRIQIPKEIGDKFRFQQFGNKVMESVYLSSDFKALQQYATFGEKFCINQPIYWKKIEEKAIRINPKTPSQIKDCIEIAFIMSKLNQGEIIFSSLSVYFKNSQITPEDTAKLLVAYANKETGQRQWIQALTKNLLDNIDSIRKQILIQTLGMFKKLKNLPDHDLNKIFMQIQKFIPQFTFKQLCYVAGFVGHGKRSKQFWQKIQKRAQQVFPTKQSEMSIVYSLQFLSCYSISTQFIRNNFIPLLRNKNNKILHELPPQILSQISKILFIYELENETKDIEQIIQTRIIKVFTNLKNVQVENLTKVIQNYAVTRIGSRQLYIFLEQVADAMFEDIKKSRDQLQLLCTLYQNSELCTPQFLEKLTTSL